MRKNNVSLRGYQSSKLKMWKALNE